MDGDEARWIVDTITQQKAEIEGLRSDLDFAKYVLRAKDKKIWRLKSELRAARSALVMIRGVVAGALEDERPVGGEFARCNDADAGLRPSDQW